MAISPDKKRYSLALTKATMDRLQEQFSKVGVLNQRQAAALITRMVDDVLYQFSEQLMPVIIESMEKKEKITEVEFMLMALQALRDIGKR
jgi:hypothetical protein